MQNMVAEAGSRAGLDQLDPPVQDTPHVLHHTYAYMLRQAGVSTELRVELTGHSIETAMKYGRSKARKWNAPRRRWMSLRTDNESRLLNRLPAVIKDVDIDHGGTHTDDAV